MISQLTLNDAPYKIHVYELKLFIVTSNECYECSAKDKDLEEHITDFI